MKIIEQFSDLMCRSTVEDWRNQVFKLGSDLGYERTRLAILPDPLAPVEAEHAFQHSNYSPDWLNKYTSEKMHYVDPTFSHCISKSVPLIWSPETFSARKQKEMYEEACGYGVRSGVTLPIHGAKGELGIVCASGNTFCISPLTCVHWQDIHQRPIEMSWRVPESIIGALPTYASQTSGSGINQAGKCIGTY